MSLYRKMTDRVGNLKVEMGVNVSLRELHLQYDMNVHGIYLDSKQVHQISIITVVCCPYHKRNAKLQLEPIKNNNVICFPSHIRSLPEFWSNSRYKTKSNKIWKYLLQRQGLIHEEDIF